MSQPQTYPRRPSALLRETCHNSVGVPFQTTGVPNPSSGPCQHRTVKTTEIISDDWNTGMVWDLVDAMTDDFRRRRGSRVASEIAEVTPELVHKWGNSGVSRPRLAAFLLFAKRDPIARAMFKQFFDGE